MWWGHWSLMPEPPAPALRQPSRLPVHPREAADRLIVALDVPALREAVALIGRLRPMVRWFKVGSELFTAAGPGAVTAVHDHGGRVFLDLKFHDIPATVAGAVTAAARLGVAMLTVHIAGGEAMLRAAAAAATGATGPPRPLVIGVTLLTSQDGGVGHIVDAARLAQACGLDGVVASAREAPQIKEACGTEFVVIAPGIRPAPVVGDDQRRTTTPEDAVRWGADYLVVGRPITRADDPQRAAEAVLASMTRTGGD